MTGDLFPRALRDRLRPVGPDVPHPGSFPTAPLPSTIEAAIAQFTEACAAVGGRVSRASDAVAVADLVLAYLESPEWRDDRHGRPAFVAWDDGRLALPEVPSLLRGRGAEQLDSWVHADPPARDADLQRLDRAVVGLTGADAALADTGSIALVHGDGRPRIVSLLPPVHVALVPVAQVHATLGSLLADQPDLLRQSANVVVVTGPSRTADIEMTLTRGVHGPRFVHVVFVG